MAEPVSVMIEQRWLGDFAIRLRSVALVLKDAGMVGSHDVLREMANDIGNRAYPGRADASCLSGSTSPETSRGHP
jgi:hypothetical protein